MIEDRSHLHGKPLSPLVPSVNPWLPKWISLGRLPFTEKKVFFLFLFSCFLVLFSDWVLKYGRPKASRRAIEEKKFQKCPTKGLSMSTLANKMGTVGSATGKQHAPFLCPWYSATCWFNSLRSNSDQRQISLCKFNVFSVREAMRFKI